MNVFRYGPQAVQHSQGMITPSNSSGHMSGGANIDDTVSGKMGKPLTYFSLLWLTTKNEDTTSIIWRSYIFCCL